MSHTSYWPLSILLYSKTLQKSTCTLCLQFLSSILSWPHFHQSFPLTSPQNTSPQGDQLLANTLILIELELGMNWTYPIPISLGPSGLFNWAGHMFLGTFSSPGVQDPTLSWFFLLPHWLLLLCVLCWLFFIFLTPNHWSAPGLCPWTPWSL